MIELWAVIGRILLDESFHSSLLGAAKGWQRFEELDDFRKILRLENGLNLGRWEVMILHSGLTRRHSKDKSPEVRLLDSVKDDSTVLAVRQGWLDLPGTHPPAFPGDFQLCAVVGLAAVDLKFRQGLFDNSHPTKPTDINALGAYLCKQELECPIFDLNPGRDRESMIKLNRFMRYKDPNGKGMLDLLQDYHDENWVQPQQHPCDGGYTKTIRADNSIAYYTHFSQTALVRLMISGDFNQGVKDLLEKYGIVFPPPPSSPQDPA